MFSKELENLIKATLVDGKLEDFEKAALLRRAQNEGVDPTELSIYINSILQKKPNMQLLTRPRRRLLVKFVQRVVCRYLPLH